MKRSQRRNLLLTVLLTGLLLCGCRDRAAEKTGKIGRIGDLNAPEFIIGGMTGIIATQEAQKRLPEAQLKEYSMPIDAFTAICSRKIDAIVLDRPTLEFMALAHPELAVMKGDLAVGCISVAASRRNEALMRQVNAFIRQYRKDGTYLQMVRRWFRTVDADMPDIPPPGACQGVLKVGVTANNEPLCFIKNGSLAGFDSEFSMRLAAWMKRKVEFVDMPYDSLVIGLESGKIDLAVAFMDAVPEREESVLFSDPYIDAPITILVRSEFLKKPPDPPREALNGGKAGFSLAAGFEKTFLRESRWKLILQGWFTTIVITFFAVILGTVLAFPLCRMCRSRRKLLSWLGERYISVIMGTPILVILMILYYVIFAKVDISGIFVAILAFAMDFAAYTSVTLRSGIEGIPRGQLEAALALGHRPCAAFLRFILPQAVRTVLPVYRGAVISTLKATSVVGYVAVMDLTKMGDIIRSRTYDAFFPLIAIALIYFLTAKCLSLLLQVIENRLDPDARRKRLQKRGTV